MKKVLTLSLAIALAALFAMPANATESRVIALGTGNNYLEDDYNIFWYPGTLPNYANTVFMTVDGSNFDGEENGDLRLNIGMTYGLGEDNQYGVLGMWFWHRDPGLNPLGTEGGCTWAGKGLFNDWLDHKFAIMWGYQMEGASIGIGFLRADNSTQITDTTPTDATTDNHTAYTTLNAGVRFDIGDNMYMDIAFDYSWAQYKREYSTTTPPVSYDRQQDKNKKYAFRARAFHEWKENFVFVPYFMYQSFDFMLKSDESPYNHYGDKATNFVFGLGANITVNEDNLIVFALDLYDDWNRKPSENPEDQSYEEKSTAFPRFYLGLESDVTDWLTFRAGGNHELVRTESKCKTGPDPEDSRTTIQTGSDFDMYLGLGFHVGDFDIDCVLNPSVPLYMGYWLTGYQPWAEDGSRPIWMISALYHF